MAGEPARCSNCGTTDGPFVRDGVAGPYCGYPPRYGRVSPAQVAERIAACVARREQQAAAKAPKASRG
jgi:hypothetical protein